VFFIHKNLSRFLNFWPCPWKVHFWLLRGNIN
jgi:hypothetical protein